MLDGGHGYILNDYGRMEPFCGFLPGIAGEKGIPLWCYYVNRGQAVSSFGVEDKEHSIMEFSPAHQAYRLTNRTGFRTFIKVGGRLYEPFSSIDVSHDMRIEMNALSISERDSEHGLFMNVSYFALPAERAAALVRCVTLKNENDTPIDVSMLDGMPCIIPYGVSLQSIKNMAQTSIAWMRAEHREDGSVCFRVRASMEDTSVVTPVEGANFACAVTDDGCRPHAWVDPYHVFGCDTSLEHPLGFGQAPLGEWVSYEEATQNIFPCCFFAYDYTLKPGQSRTHYMLVGQADSIACVGDVIKRVMSPETLDAKLELARSLAWELTDRIATETASPVFDMYCRQTYLDNLLRGGYPRALRDGGVVYLYSRKHGDPERDYNAFKMLPEYMSQGNGNYRDVNQNRRCDVLFEPQVMDANIRLFYGLIQADGYNPLVVERVRYSLGKAEHDKALSFVAQESADAALELLSRGFTPGELRMALEDWRLIGDTSADDVFETIIASAEPDASAAFGEGYWSDHWTYCLDQIESYISIYPEREESLLYDERVYGWYDSPKGVLPRAKRYEHTERGVRQIHSLYSRETRENRLCDKDGRPIKSTLIEKLLLLCAVKIATLDPCGMGVEMEGGKPGWYDALNGLPALLGSSMPETLALCRLIRFVRDSAVRYGRTVCVLEEMAKLMQCTRDILAGAGCVSDTGDTHINTVSIWNRLNDVKEAYREGVYFDIGGSTTELSSDEIIGICEAWLAYAERGVEAAMEIGGGLCPTYFTYEVTNYAEDEDELHPLGFKCHTMPDFLEGQVGCMRVDNPRAEKEKLYREVRKSGLYDNELSMYKVNASLENASYEIGRARAFTPGWLENESIWLHMEYKYLLELLRAQLYEQFEQDFRNAAIPFLEEKRYGRSTLENSSFIASSVNPEPRIRGKGFVARLSGSTAEFLSIWQIMLLGARLFTVENGELTLRLSPMLPDYLTQGRNRVRATLLGQTEVEYLVEDGACYRPNEYTQDALCVYWRDGTAQSFEGGTIRGEYALRVRNGEAKRITLKLAKGGADK